MQVGGLKSAFFGRMCRYIYEMVQDTYTVHITYCDSLFPVSYIAKVDRRFLTVTQKQNRYFGRSCVVHVTMEG